MYMYSSGVKESDISARGDRRDQGLAKRLNSIHKGLITAHNMRFVRTAHPEMKCLSQQDKQKPGKEEFWPVGSSPSSHEVAPMLHVS